jgi:hypothetical protein
MAEPGGGVTVRMIMGCCRISRRSAPGQLPPQAGRLGRHVLFQVETALLPRAQ